VARISDHVLNEGVFSGGEVFIKQLYVLQARRLQLDDEAERRRVLEDALHVLAAEHHVLSTSLAHFPEVRYIEEL
jgi:hypothetical protein